VKQILKNKKNLKKKKWRNKSQLIFKKSLNLLPMMRLLKRRNLLPMMRILKRLQLLRKTILLETKKKTIILNQYKSRTQLRKTLVKLTLKRK